MLYTYGLHFFSNHVCRNAFLLAILNTLSIRDRKGCRRKRKALCLGVAAAAPPRLSSPDRVLTAFPVLQGWSPQLRIRTRQLDIFQRHPASFLHPRSAPSAMSDTHRTALAMMENTGNRNRHCSLDPVAAGGGPRRR